MGADSQSRNGINLLGGLDKNDDTKKMLILFRAPYPHLRLTLDERRWQIPYCYFSFFVDTNSGGSLW